jgi:LysM repeat protein
MRQVKRFFYFAVLNIIISAVTVIVVLQVWQQNHPSTTADNTPMVIIVTPTQSVVIPLLRNNSGAEEVSPVEMGTTITQTNQLTPTPKMLSYQVKEGDTLGALAVEFNISITDIMMANDLSDPDSITVGQILFIPTAPLPKATSTTLSTTIVASPTQTSSATATHEAVASATPTEAGQEPQVIIETVIGAGVLDSERVQLLRTGVGELSLAGWRLEDGTGNVYLFPDLTLYTGGTINLNTRSGQDTVMDLYWGLAAPIWQSGKVAMLYDADNVLRASYSIP